MARSRSKTIVTQRSEVTDNVRTYRQSLAKHRELAGRVSQHPAWYAIRHSDGSWLFGPSKFVGYAENTAEAYLASYSRADGRETERALSEWFQEVDPDSALGRELKQAFKIFAAGFGKVPNKRWRVSVARSELGGEVMSGRGSDETTGGRKRSARIISDPSICGGRPCIRGTRMRVSDIVDMIAAGAARAEILSDYPYLKDEDITSALQYASHAVDHRIVRAA